MNEKKQIAVEAYIVSTAMGKVRQGNIPCLSNEQIENFNEIGYSGKLNGVKMTREDYLNSLNSDTFTMVQLACDNGEFREKFLIVRAYLQ